MSKKALVVSIIIFLLFIIFVWPTLYRYEKPSGRAGYLMLRINRITGEAAILNGSGWMQLRYNPEEYAVEAPEPEAAPAPEPGKVW